MDAWLWVCISAGISATALAEELFYLRIEGISRSLRQSTTKERFKPLSLLWPTILAGGSASGAIMEDVVIW